MLFGFTEEEVKKIYDYYAPFGILSISKSSFFETAKSWYNSYRFSEDTEANVYNPDMIFYFLEKVIRRKKASA